MRMRFVRKYLIFIIYALLHFGLTTRVSSFFQQGRRKHLKSGGTRSEKGHMTTPINGQNSKGFESIPNQVHTVFGWELKLSKLGCNSKTAISYRKFI